MARKTVDQNISYDSEKKRYYVTLHCGSDERGNRLRKTRCFPTLEQARLVRDNFQRNRTLRTQILPAGVTVGQWLDYWLEVVIRPHRAVTTTYGYQKIIDNHLKPALGKIPLHELTAVQVQQYLFRQLEEGLSNNTVRKHHTLLSTALGLAVRQDMLERNVAQSVEAPPKESPQHSFYSADQLQRLFDLVRGRPLEPVVKLAGYLGLRRSEICGLKWANVDFGEGVLYICEARTSANGVAVDKGPKSSSSVRRLSFAGIPELRKLLEEKYETFCRQRERFGEGYNPEGFVLTRSHGKPYSPDYLSGWFSRFVRDNNLPRCTLHGLRHSFASIANSQKVPIYSICKALGHSSTSITSQIYLHLFDETHRDVVALVGDAIAHR